MVVSGCLLLTILQSVSFSLSRRERDGDGAREGRTLGKREKGGGERRLSGSAWSEYKRVQSICNG